MSQLQHAHLFEVSWEVCNKVGGIHTVLRSKVGEVIKEFGDNYFLIGPNLPRNIEFEETDEPCWRTIREPLAIRGFDCRFGRWTLPGRPKVILIRPAAKYDKDQILFHLWEKYGVDSIAGGWDYIEPVLFSTACGEVIATVCKSLFDGEMPKVIAHFHEWMTGAGLLYLKEKAPYVATVFTTHATVLGRSMMGAGRDIYSELDTISPIEEARTYSVAAKHSIEHVSAREADVFTAVSEITAREAQKFLGRRPAPVTENGINLEDIPNLAVDRDGAVDSRRNLLEFGRRFLGLPIPDDTCLLLISGRYEFSNKGIDVFLEALARIKDQLGDRQHLLVYLFVIGGHLEHRADRIAGSPSSVAQLCTHRLPNENNDAILIHCLQRGLSNTPDNKINVIFSPVYLSEGDGVFNQSYYDLLKGCDLAVFPSKYEPWGYTPLEAAAYAVPTISTDLAGFGIWAKQHVSSNGPEGVYVLPRLGKNRENTVEELAALLLTLVSLSPAEQQAQRSAVRRIAEHATWSRFYPHYVTAYESALRAAETRVVRDAAIRAGGLGQLVQATSSMQPHFRPFVVETDMPLALARLRELAYNLWWCWQPDAVELFARIDPFLWEATSHNPVRLLDQIPAARLAELAENDSYVRAYADVIAALDTYLNDPAPCPFCDPAGAVTWSRPVAYFSTEFAIHESLPVYSGGLGVLSGDHLKSASDLNIPLTAVTLFYKHGYFTQKISADGSQIAEYVDHRFADLPVRQIRDENGAPTMISVDLPGRTLHATVWKVAVGRVTLYLLDSDLPANTVQDRSITGQLYVGDERVRIEQEILLGIGGARALRRLGIRPSVYHLNEGHSAFLIFENIRRAMHDHGFTFDEARELVKSQVVFTTHTPVEAGNERFSRELMQHYFTSYIKEVNISPERFFELGRLDAGENQPFILTILALKAAFMANGVSQLHGRMSRKMWERVWNGIHRTMVPITSITNGVHVPSFVAPEMHRLLDTYLGVDWTQDLLNPEKWSRIRNIPDSTLWDVRCQLRSQLITYVREYVSEHWSPSKESDLTREEVVSRLRGSTLTIGFARRFAPYKRAYLLFQDLDRLDRIVNNPRRPVQFVFAGKAHPKDGLGCELVKQVVAVSRDKRFSGRVIFIENYDLAVAKRLVRGVDVWLNTPRRPYEASGTSGQKVAINCGVNLSVADGWWCEGAEDDNGWTIGPAARDVDEDTVSNDIQDASHLYSLLEDTVVPLFYQRNNKGLPEGWLNIMRRSLETIVPRFNTHRMLIDYFNQMYTPCALRSTKMLADDGKLAKELADWKRQAAGKFSSLHILDITLGGVTDGSLQVGKVFGANVRVDLGEFRTEEVSVDLVVGLSDPKQQIRDPYLVTMHPQGKPQNRIVTFSAEHTVTEKGSYAYGIRIVPSHPNLCVKEELGLVIWA